MRHDTQIALLERVLAHVEAGTTQLADASSRVPVSSYTSEARLAAEQKSLFRRLPLIVGHASEIPAAGDFVTHDASGVPILVVRGPDGEVRAFVNACRHRGTKLVAEASGHRKGLVCRYHAWAYDLRGSLIHVPQPEGFPGLDCAQTGLVALPIEVRHGFLWVTPTPGAAGEIGLGAIGDDLEAFDLATHVVHRKVVCRRKANWKLVIEAFLEGYHVKSLHRESIARFFLGYGTVFDAFGPNLRSVGARRNIGEARGQAREAWDVRALGTVFYFLFPNTVLVFHPDWVSHLALWPDGTDGCVYEHRMLIPRAPASAEEGEHWDKTYRLIEESVFQKEDLEIVESIQATVRSGADAEFRIGRMEAGIRLFHDAMEAALAGE